MTERSKLDPLIEGYLSYMKDVGRKPDRTIADVRCTLKRLSLAAGETPLWKWDLARFIRWLDEERSADRSPMTLAKNISHARQFLDYAWRSGRTDRNVLDGFALQDAKRRTVPRALSLEEAQRLVAACRTETALDRRNRAMILILYGCGLRTHELCDLSVTDIDAQRQELTVRNGKGGRQRVVPIPDAVHKELLAYLLERGAKRGALFKTEHKNRPVGPVDVGEAVGAVARGAKIEWHVTPKTLRHTYATHLMDAGVDIGVISVLMGHRSPTETGVYLHALKGRAEEAMDKLRDNTDVWGEAKE